MAIEIHYEKRIINNVIREADSKSHRDYIVVTALAAMFLFALFAYGWQHYQWIQYSYPKPAGSSAWSARSCAIPSGLTRLPAVSWAWSLRLPDSL